eukprot:gnl/TRDRNA2_/TRDRNA2_176872_c8_seq9.p1 gnl/TRDRNA2_/TRDRNA2_176872_c8~~gnl/TRDRNA2_/TRDRNA2_176872_c8_seq9.p1  ORF type:complete len:458 (-),score=60.49 gnl/TRDRNA2_/TRDRNA2_176872_c8_seq9:125-1372(-)
MPTDGTTETSRSRSPSALIALALAVALLVQPGAATGPSGSDPSLSSTHAAPARAPFMAQAKVGHIETSTMSASDMLRDPKFTSTLADRLMQFTEGIRNQKPRSRRFKFPKGTPYQSNFEKEKAHWAAANSMRSYLANMTMHHPQVAETLQKIRLNEQEQHVAYKVLDHLSDPRLLDLGHAVAKALHGQTITSRKDMKKRLEAKLSPSDVKNLMNLKDAIFPPGYNNGKIKHGSTKMLTSKANLPTLKKIATTQTRDRRLKDDELKDLAPLPIDEPVPPGTPLLDFHEGAGLKDPIAPKDPGPKDFIPTPPAPPPVPNIPTDLTPPDEDPFDEVVGGNQVCNKAWTLEWIFLPIIPAATTLTLTAVFDNYWSDVIFFSVEDVFAVIDCALMPVSCLHWIGCVLNLISAGVQALLIW